MGKYYILVFIFICLIFLIISVKDVVKWKLDSNKIEEQVQEIEDIVIIEEAIESDEIEIIEQEEEIPQSNPY